MRKQKGKGGKVVGFHMVGTQWGSRGRMGDSGDGTHKDRGKHSGTP